MAKEKDPVKASELQRQFKQASKQEAYATMALRALDPRAKRISRLLDLAEEE